MSIKLIAVDIDGTLVNSQKEITPEVFSAIQDAKEAGVKVVIATGRPIAGVAKLRNIHCARINPRQHAYLLPHS